MYVYVDEKNRITAYNPNDMSGNEGWKEINEILGEPIVEEHGVPMYRYSRKHAVARTAAEIAADIPEPVPPEPTPLDLIQQQLDEQADALIELAEMIVGGE